MSLFYVYVYVSYELLFSSIMLCALLSYVYMCACHVYCTINSLTYLQQVVIASVFCFIY